MNWYLRPFEQFTNHQLYDLLQLRVDVFVVEQNCPYPELDNKDRSAGTYHLLGYHQDQLVACARLLPPGVSYSNVSIGRLCISKELRGRGIGKALVITALDYCATLWPNQPIDIGAQAYLLRFYNELGFKEISDSYLEDGIPHLDMRFTPKS